jgi:hypothetical protein
VSFDRKLGTENQQAEHDGTYSGDQSFHRNVPFTSFRFKDSIRDALFATVGMISLILFSPILSGSRCWSIRENADRINCGRLAEGANGPTTLEADEIPRQKGIAILPLIPANAGRVTVPYFEWVQDAQNYTWTLDEVTARLHRILIEAYQRTHTRTQRDDVDMRTAAMIEGVQRVAEAKLSRGLFPRIDPPRNWCRVP